MPLPYSVPDIQDNPDGWGPATVPEQLKDLPFAAYNKSDKIGKAADWTQQAYQKYPG
jgi:translation initiation factor 3 subunit D